jgi:hypothetical protein
VRGEGDRSEQYARAIDCFAERCKRLYQYGTPKRYDHPEVAEAEKFAKGVK